MYQKIRLTPLKGLFILSFIFLFILVNTFIVFADFYVIAGSKGIGKEIKSLPYTISSSGFYYITKDLSCAAGLHGIIIDADNVTLDLMGFRLVGPGSSGSHDGIYMNERTNVEIRNGTISKFERNGIFEYSYSAPGSGHRIINVRVRENGYMGINLRGMAHLVEKCTVAHNGNAGIHSGPGSTIIGNTCNNNVTHGISLNYDSYISAVGSIVKDNNCFQNTKEGILTDSGFIVSGNVCNSNGENGIHVGDGSTVTGNTCYNNFLSGIDAGACTTLTGNTSFKNKDGIKVGLGSTVVGNTCRENTADGIISSGHSLFYHNTSTYNTGDDFIGGTFYTQDENHFE